MQERKPKDMELHKLFYQFRFLYAWKAAVLLLLVVHILLLVLMNIHIVRLESETVFLLKKTATLKHTYADVRYWGAKEFLTGPEALQEYLLETQVKKYARRVESQEWYKRLRVYFDELDSKGQSRRKPKLPQQ